MARRMNSFVQYLIPTLVVLLLFREPAANRWAPRELGIDVLLAVAVAFGATVLVEAISAGVGRLRGRRG